MEPAMNVLTACLILSSLLMPNQNITSLERDDVDLPLELILAVDVSLSMSQEFPDSMKVLKQANDPRGARWDGIQYAIDTSKDTDRISLVVFRGTPAFLTSLLDNTGYITLGKLYDDPRTLGKKIIGRDLLKELVSEIQKLERQFAQNYLQTKENEELRKKLGFYESMAVFENEIPLSFFKKGATKMLTGTSNVVCLKAIAKSGLIPNQADPNKRRFLFLFTDGQDEFPIADLEKVKIPENLADKIELKDLTYVQDRKNISADTLQEWLGKLLDFSRFSQSRTPVISFALGEYCDNELLRGVSNLSRGEKAKDGDNRERLASFYQSKDCVELLTVLQEVVLELRHDWKLPIARSTNQFVVPQLPLWKEVGILVYRRLFQDNLFDAEAPNEKYVAKLGDLPPAGDPPRPRPLTRFQPARSRSHWFYTLLVDQLDKPLAPDSNLEIKLANLPSDQSWQGMATIRTKYPLFNYVSPNAGSKFTPKDEIIFRIDYMGECYSDYKFFKHEQFEIELIVKHSKNTNVPVQKHIFQCLPAENDSSGKPIRPFIHALILDKDPNSKGNMDLLGSWDVDITIKAISGPLEGATRKLIRRQIQIGDYPDIDAPPKLVVSNYSDTPGALDFSLALKTTTKPKINIASIMVELVDVEKPFMIENFNLRKNQISWPLDNQISISSQGRDWAEKTIGMKNAKLKITLPWKKTPSFIDLIIDKRKYQVFPGKTPFIDGTTKKIGVFDVIIPATLKTKFGTFEQCQLNGKNNVIVLKRKNTDESIEVAISGENKPFQIFGGDTPEFPNSGLTVKLDKPIAPGRWVGEVDISGPAIESKAAYFELLVDQPKLFVEIDGSFKQIDSLNILGLSGLSLDRNLKVKSFLDQEVKILSGKIIKTSDQNNDQSLPLAGFNLVQDPKSKDKIRFEGKIPFSIPQNYFNASIMLELESATLPLITSFPIIIQGLHHGVQVEPQGTLQLLPPDKTPCAGFSKGEIKLKSEADKANSARWYVTSSPIPKDKIGLKWLSPERVELFLNGSAQNILNQPGDNKKPTPPVSKGMVENILVQARTTELDPGIYHQILKFHSYQDFPSSPEGPVFELPIQIVVTGHELFLQHEPSIEPFVGTPLEMTLNVTSFHSLPNEGFIQLVDKNGAPMDGSTAIVVDGAKPVLRKTDDKDPLIIRQDYKVTVIPTRAGKNYFQVRWKKSCLSPDGKEDYFSKIFEVDVKGKMIVSHRVAYIGEELLVSLALNPEEIKEKSTTIKIKALRGDGKEAIVFDLYDDGRFKESGDNTAGDGVYNGKIRFQEPGHYDLALDSDSSLVKTQPLPLDVGFELITNKNLGNLSYGGGTLGTLLGVREHLDQQAISFINKYPGHLKLKAQLVFPETFEESKRLLYLDPAIVKYTVEFDKSIHLDGSIYSSDIASENQMSKVIEKEITGENPFNINVLAKLSDDAALKTFEAGVHPTLNSTNGLLILLDLEWHDRDGNVLKRKVIVPFSISTQSWIMKGLIALVFLIVIVFICYKIVIRIINKSKQVVLNPNDPLAGPSIAVTGSSSSNTTPGGEPKPKSSPPPRGPEKNNIPRKPPRGSDI
jgi:hypothetical protein